MKCYIIYKQDAHNCGYLTGLNNGDKYTFNVGSAIGTTTDYPKTMDTEDLNELIDIRNRIKKLAYKLKREI